jgi:hypothetical protein
MHGHAITAATLDATDHAARDPNGVGKTLLRPPTSTTQRPQPESESHYIHPSSLVGHAHQRLIAIASADWRGWGS